VYRKIDIGKLDWFADFSRFIKILAVSQHPDLRMNADTQRKSPSSMNDIEAFLTACTFAVACASEDRSKYGNKVFHALAASGRVSIWLFNTTRI
jgi:hypothetical protein